MASTRLTTTAYASSANASTKKFTRIVKIRNMTGRKRGEDTRVVVPVRTTENPSPLKKSATNRVPSQDHTRTPVDDAIAHELAQARFLIHDLADHVFGHIISTEMARDVLRKFVEDRIVHVHEETGSRTNMGHLKVTLGSESDRVKIEDAIQQAFKAADMHDCNLLGTNPRDKNPESSFTNAERKGNENQGGRKEKAVKYTFSWPTFPVEPLKEHDLVSFMNKITDHALAIVQPELTAKEPESNIQLRHRFAAPEDKHHAVPLSYEPDGEDMRPDFLLLPIEAFNDDLTTVNPKYINFTAARLVGESKNKDVMAGIEQMQRYARGLKRAQPWVHYVLGMTVTKDRAVFLRGDASGTERVDLMFADGRGCIEFIRILLGLALADQEDLGANPEVRMESREAQCVLRNVSHRGSFSRSKGRKKGPAFSVPDGLLRAVLSKAGSESSSTPCGPHSASAAIFRPQVSSTSSKRVRSYIDDDEQGTPPKKSRTDGEGISSKEPKIAEETESGKGAKKVPRVIFVPTRAYEYDCVGILFTACSIRGRGTTVFCATDLEDSNKLLALKMAWQDLRRLVQQEEVMERLKNNDPHPNVVVPNRSFQPKMGGKRFTTLDVLRGFLEDQIGQLSIENCVLTVSVSELRRPVKYFWGVHDFVRGLRGALLGHEYLTKIGVLHRDISENNIVLGRRPGDVRGYLIDFDIAILQDREEPSPAVPATRIDPFYESPVQKSSNLPEADKNEPMKGIRTGTFPYISYNVLFGRRHTYFDDVESFLYVLFLFFFSYAGPLSENELRTADEEGFVQPVGSGRHPHTRNWPKEYADWADGSPHQIASLKESAIVQFDGVTKLSEGKAFLDCLENNWPTELHRPITRLIDAAFRTFQNGSLFTSRKTVRTEVEHAEFVAILDRWLDMYSDIEEAHSNCPFKQGDVSH